MSVCNVTFLNSSVWCKTESALSQTFYQVVKYISKWCWNTHTPTEAWDNRWYCMCWLILLIKSAPHRFSSVILFSLGTLAHFYLSIQFKLTCLPQWWSRKVSQANTLQCRCTCTGAAGTWRPAEPSTPSTASATWQRWDRIEQVLISNAHVFVELNPVAHNRPALHLKHPFQRPPPLFFFLIFACVELFKFPTGFKVLSFQLHVVHYNSDKYRSFTEARDKPDGLAVLAFFYDVGKPHTHRNCSLSSVFFNLLPYLTIRFFSTGCQHCFCYMAISSAERGAQKKVFVVEQKRAFEKLALALWSEWHFVFLRFLPGSKALLTSHLHVDIWNKCPFVVECCGSRLGEVVTAATLLLASTATAPQTGWDLAPLGHIHSESNDSLIV